MQLALHRRRWLLAAAILAALAGCARMRAAKDDRCAVPPIAGGVTCVCGPPHGDLVVPEFIRTVATADAAEAPIALADCVLQAVSHHEAIRQAFHVCPATGERPPCDGPWPVSLVLIPKVMIGPREYLAAVKRVDELIYEVERAYCAVHRGQVELSIHDALLTEAEQRFAAVDESKAEALLTVQQRGQLDLQLSLLREQRLTALAGAAGAPGLMGAELALREAMGLPPDDGCHLWAEAVAEDSTPLATPENWTHDAYHALWHRAELRLARGEAYDAEWKSEQPSKPTRKMKRQNHDPTDDICAGRHEFFQKAIALRTLERQVLFELVRAYRQYAAAGELLAQRQSRREVAEGVLAARAEELQKGQITWDLWLAAQRDANAATLAVEDAEIERHLATGAYRRSQGTLALCYGIQLLATPERKPKDKDKKRQAEIEACIQRTLETMQVELGPAWPVSPSEPAILDAGEGEEVAPPAGSPSNTLPEPQDDESPTMKPAE